MIYFRRKGEPSKLPKSNQEADAPKVKITRKGRKNKNGI